MGTDVQNPGLAGLGRGVVGRAHLVVACRVAAIIAGLVGAVIAGFFMLMGPLISTPPPEGGYLLAVVGYPLLTLLAGFVVAVSLRAGLAIAILALACAVVAMAPYRGDESLSDLVALGGMIAGPALIVVVLAGMGLIAEERSV